MKDVDLSGHTLVRDLPRAKLFIKGSPPKVDFILIYLERGIWRQNRRGSCSMRVAADGSVRGASWRWASTLGRRLTVIVYDSGLWCRDTPLSDTVTAAQIRYTADSVSLRLLAKSQPKERDSLRDVCYLLEPEYPTTFTILLTEPIGDRTLIDGGSVPEVPAPKA